MWRAGDALLALPLEDTVEIAPVGDDGLAMGRDGPLDLAAPPGLPMPRRPARAVVARTAGGRVAIAADSVEGVLSVAGDGAEPVPAWLRRLSPDHIAGVIRLPGGRVAALLGVEALGHR